MEKLPVTWSSSLDFISSIAIIAKLEALSNENQNYAEFLKIKKSWKIMQFLLKITKMCVDIKASTCIVLPFNFCSKCMGSLGIIHFTKIKVELL